MNSFIAVSLRSLRWGLLAPWHFLAPRHSPKWTSVIGFAFSITPFKLSFVKCTTSSAFVSFLVLISSVSVWLHSSSIGFKVGAFVEAFVKAFVEVFVDAFVDRLMDRLGSIKGLGSTECSGLIVGFVVGAVGFAVGFVAGLVGLAGALGATEGFEGPEDCAMRLSKCIIGFLDLLDRRSIGSSMIN